MDHQLRELYLESVTTATVLAFFPSANSQFPDGKVPENPKDASDSYCNLLNYDRVLMLSDRRDQWTSVKKGRF